MLKTKKKIKEIPIFPKEESRISPKKPFNPKILLFLVFLFGISMAYIVWKNGQADISEERKAKFQNEVEKLEKAEQYALIAEESKLYPCLNCKGMDSVFLLRGEIWKYGVSTNGEKRYTQTFLRTNRLIYFRQFMGSLQACLVEEKRKIYHYPLLPENLKRLKPLDRPAGNPQDR